MPRWRAAVGLAGRITGLFMLLAAAARLPGVNDSSLSPATAQSLWQQVQQDEKKGRPEQALKALAPLLQAFPQSPTYLEASAKTLMTLNRFSESAATWETYIRVAPTPADACPHLGRAYEAAGDPARALDAHRRCLAMDPSKSDLWLYLALTLERQGNIVEAAHGYRVVLERSPGYNDARLGLARIKYRQGNIEEADALSQSVLNVSPSNSDALLVAAQVSEKRGDPLKAISQLTKAITVAPSNPDLHQVLGRLCRANPSPDCPAPAGGPRP